MLWGVDEPFHPVFLSGCRCNGGLWCVSESAWHCHCVCTQPRLWALSWWVPWLQLVISRGASLSKRAWVGLVTFPWIRYARTSLIFKPLVLISRGHPLIRRKYRIMWGFETPAVKTLPLDYDPSRSSFTAPRKPRAKHRSLITEQGGRCWLAERCLYASLHRVALSPFISQTISQSTCFSLHTSKGEKDTAVCRVSHVAAESERARERHTHTRTEQLSIEVRQVYQAEALERTSQLCFCKGQSEA